MNQKDFIEKFHTLLPECPPEAAQLWCDFAVECVDQQQYVHFKAAESRDASMESWLEVLYEGLRQTKETFGAELAAKVGSLSCECCCLYPGEMFGAAECLREGGSAQEILTKIESGEIDCTDLFAAAPPRDPPAKIYMSEQEFTAHMDELIPTPSVETNSNLLDLANSGWHDSVLLSSDCNASIAERHRESYYQYHQGIVHKPSISTNLNKTLVRSKKRPQGSHEVTGCSGDASWV